MQHVKTTFHGVIVLLAIISTVGLSGWATASSELYSDTPCPERPDLYQKAVTAANKGREAEINATANNHKKMDEAMKPLLQDGILNTCLQFKGISMGNLGFPSFDDIMDKLISSAKQAACSAVNSAYDSAYNSATNAANQAVVLPGGIGVVDAYKTDDLGQKVIDQGVNQVENKTTSTIKATSQTATQNFYNGMFK
jgi:hypothetical protein